MPKKHDEVTDDEIPPFPRMAKQTSLEQSQNRLRAIDERTAWLAEKGLRLHNQVIAERAQLVAQLGERTVECDDGDPPLHPTAIAGSKY